MSNAYDWVPDEAVTRCYSCSCEFSSIIPKHHCRKCGQIFCHSCSRYKGLIRREESVTRPPNTSIFSLIVSDEDVLSSPQRLCFKCYELVKDIQKDLQQKMSPSYQKTMNPSSIISVPAIMFRLEDEIEKAMALMEISKGKHDSSNFEECYGLVFLTIVKAGLVFTGRYGTGFVISRLDNEIDSNSTRLGSTRLTGPGKWSAPSAITLGGLGWGFQIGAEVQHVCFVLPNKTTVEAFKSSGQFSLGGEISLALIMGMSVEADVSAGRKGVSYGHGLGVTQGLFFGTSIEATIIAARKDVNRSFYGERVTPSQLLSGTIPAPPAVSSLHTLIEEFLAS